jgi:hypothetical protein
MNPEEWEIAQDSRGVKFYRNKLTQVTTSEKPDCFKLPQEIFRVKF